MAFNKAGTLLSSRPAAPVVTDKHSTRLLLKRSGVPAPEGRSFASDRLADAVAYASELGYPLVVKPRYGTQGEGVVTGISDKEELQWAFREITKTKYADGDVLIERHVDGDAYRVMVVGGQAVSVLISTRGEVKGDGRRTVRELIEERQESRRQNPHLMSRPIQTGQALEHLLNRQGTGLDEVLEGGQKIKVTYGSNTSQGGEPAQVLERAHPSILEASVQAVEAIPGLGFAGVDFLLSDIERPLTDQDAAICEINSMPALDSHEFPLSGRPISVARKAVVHSAAGAGLALGERLTEGVANVRMEISPRYVRYQRWIRSCASSLGLDFKADFAKMRDLRATVAGNIESIALWLAMAVHGPHGQNPRTVEVQHA